MKLCKLLFEDTVRQSFLKFQHLLADLDDGFEQADPVMTKAMRDTSLFTFIRSEPSETHKVRCIVLTVYEDSNGDALDYRIAVYKSVSLSKHSLAMFAKTAATLDEVMIYLDRVLNA